MVLIEPVPIDEQEDTGNVVSKPKSKPPISSSSSEVVESSGAVTSTGDVSDGFETASEKDLSDEDDEVVKEMEQQDRPEPEASLPEIKDSNEPSINENVSNEDSKEKALADANDAKLEGNRLFKSALYEEALVQYDLALQIAPDMPSSVEIRSNCHANRALCFSKLGKTEESAKECTKALELNPNYVKVLVRRAEAHEKIEHFEEAIADLKKVLELDESNETDKMQASRNIQRLEPLAAVKREKMKEEMIGKLKEMGNSILGRFGMSVDNFKAIQDPNTGSYSISFQR